MIMYSADAGRPDFKITLKLEEQGISFRSENLIPRIQ